MSVPALGPSMYGLGDVAFFDRVAPLYDLAMPPADGTAPADREQTHQLQAPPGQELGPYAAVYRETIDSVVQVRVYSDRGGSQGRGRVVADGHVVTNPPGVQTGDDV